jgi:hypothetical protein
MFSNDFLSKIHTVRKRNPLEYSQEASPSITSKKDEPEFQENHEQQYQAKDSGRIVQKVKAMNMQYAFNQNFKHNATLTETPERHVNDHLSKKMSLYLNKALHKLNKNIKI